VVARLNEARITVLDPASGSVTAHHLNPHIDYCTVESGGHERGEPVDARRHGDHERRQHALRGSIRLERSSTARNGKGRRVHNPNPARRRFSFKSSSTSHDPGANRIVPSQTGSPGDPTLHGGELVVYNAAGLTSDSVAVPLLSGWSPLTKGSTVVGWRFKSTDSSSAVSSVVVRADKV
jgi:hypothetical protein